MYSVGVGVGRCVGRGVGLLVAWNNPNRFESNIFLKTQHDRTNVFVNNAENFQKTNNNNATVMFEKRYQQAKRILQRLAKKKIKTNTSYFIQTNKQTNKYKYSKQTTTNKQKQTIRFHKTKRRTRETPDKCQNSKILSAIHKVTNKHQLPHHRPGARYVAATFIIGWCESSSSSSCAAAHASMQQRPSATEIIFVFM